MVDNNTSLKTVTQGKPQGWSGSVKDRQGSTMGGAWGDNGAARPVTQAYKNGYDLIDWSKK
jgi:hypothetical protein